MADRILFVDDEPSVLDGYKRLLRSEFAIDTAQSGEQGLASIRDCGPYSVVISDMRMPGMNGTQFLSQARHIAPDTTRMLLTGHADLDAAMSAVNEGNIFRFLSKPCEKENMAKAITACLDQHRLVTAEKEILERTLMGSIKVLTEVLSAASPEAFGRSTRIARYVRHLVARSKLPAPWRFEAAAMLSQLGCVTLDSELIKSSYVGNCDAPEDRLRFAAHPQVAQDLLANIPRLEHIGWMISQQLSTGVIQPDNGILPKTGDDIVLGAKILRLALAFDNLRTRGSSDKDAIASLRNRRLEFGLELIEALAAIEHESAHMELRKVATAKLTPGMILQQEIITRTGMLVVPNGQEITLALQIKIENLFDTGAIGKDIMALVPV